jgi:hypothetical protein
VAAQRFDHRVDFDRTRFLDRLRPDLNRGVGIEGSTFGLVVRGAEPAHHVRRLRFLTRIGSGREHRAFARWTGDKPELLGVQGVAADQLKIVASVTRLPDQERCFGTVSAVVQHVDPGGLHF